MSTKPFAVMLRVYAVHVAAAALIVIVGLVLRPPEREVTWAIIPTPNPEEQARDARRYAALPVGTGFVGAKVSAGENQLSTDEPITFDHVTWDTAELWDHDEPQRLTIPSDGFYRIGTQITVLGWGYRGSPPSPYWTLSVIRNGDPTDLVCSNTQTDEDPSRAQLADCASTDWFLAGDYVELLVTEGRTVEANWPGRSNLSPVLIVELVSD